MEEEISKDKLVSIFRKMCMIRSFEDKLYYLFLNDPTIPGTMHQYNGQEAVAVGVCENLEKEDYITSTHRGHGHCIAKGVSIDKMMAEMYGKSTGCCKGMGGSMHLADFSVGILGATGIVGAGLPIACGAALSSKLRGSNQVTVCFFGDGAANEGSFHESLNLAAIWKLPVVFVCENNLYGFSTPLHKVMAIENISDRASGYGMHGETVDGNNVLAVYRSAREAVRRARDGKCPALIEYKTYRHRGHSRFESAFYRPKEEVEEWMKRDPIKRFKDFLLEKNILTEDELTLIENDVTRIIDRSVEFAKNSPSPLPDEPLKYVFSQ
jgi:pyruvate dehydrogenase E1 component alpha subunit